MHFLTSPCTLSIYRSKGGLIIDSKQWLEILTHLSCLLALCSFLVRDMLLLRSLAIASNLVWIGAMIFTHNVITASLFWGSIFIIINIWQILLLLKENRAVDFNEEERSLFESLFANLKPGEFVKILQIGTWMDFPAGKVLVENGNVAEGVWVLCRGEADVKTSDGIVKARLGVNDMIGEMSYLTGNPATTSVIMTTAGRGLFWSRETLHQLFGNYPTLKIGFQSIISANLAEKLKR